MRLSDGAVVLIGSRAAGHDRDDREARCPCSGKIPILGWLFKSTSDRVVRRRMVATVQATQIHSPSEERAEQMERVLAFQRRNARIQPLRALVSEPYALLVATRDSREAAAELLPEHPDLPGTRSWSSGTTTPAAAALRRVSRRLPRHRVARRTTPPSCASAASLRGSRSQAIPILRPIDYARLRLAARGSAPCGPRSGRPSLGRPDLTTLACGSLRGLRALRARSGRPSLGRLRGE